MNATGYARLAASLFAIIAVLQLIRAIGGWPVAVGTVAIPIWLSWIAAVVMGALAWLGFSASRVTAGK
jgi:hypothetical protein